MNKLSILFPTLFLWFCFTLNAQQTKYWISQMNGNWSDSNNWSTSLNGQPTGGIPDINDVVIFSGSDKGNCYVDINVAVKKIETTNGYQSTIFFDASHVVIGNGGLSHYFGTLNGQSCHIKVNGQLEIHTSFTSTNKILELNNGIVVSDHQFFDSNSGTVLINVNGSTTIPHYCQFNNLMLNGFGQFNVLNLPEGIDVLNNLTINDTLSKIKFDGDRITIAGHFYAAQQWLNGTSKLELNGYHDQRIVGNKQDTIKLLNLTINKPSGAVLTKEKIIVESQLKLLQGHFIIGNTGCILFVENAQIDGGNDWGFIEGLCIKRGISDFMLPIGSKGKYSPITISNISSLTDVACQFLYYQPNYANNLTPPTTQINQCSFWHISATSNVTMQLSFDMVEFNGCLNVANNADYEILKLNSTQSWEIVPASMNGNILISDTLHPNHTYTIGSTAQTECSEGILYWVGYNSSAWDNPLNWSKISGGIGGTTIPCPHNTIVFDKNSHGDCHLNSDVSVSKALLMPAYSGTIKTNGNTLNITELFK